MGLQDQGFFIVDFRMPNVECIRGAVECGLRIVELLQPRHPEPCEGSGRALRFALSPHMANASWIPDQVRHDVEEWHPAPPTSS